MDVDGQRYTGRHVLLATGSVPRSLPGLGIDGDRIISSDHALTLDRVPRSAIVLGGGLSGIATLYRRVPSLWAPFIFSEPGHVRTRLLPPRHGDSSGVRGAAWLWNQKTEIRSQKPE